MKIARLLFWSILCALAFPSYAQLNIGTIDPGPYTPGSTIAAPLSIGNSSCIAIGNTFQLYLSNATGDFTSETLIGTYNGFYAAFVNGRLPTGAAAPPPGTGYRLRIRSTSPEIFSAPSNAFTIAAGTAVDARLTSSNPLADEAFGFCSKKTGAAAAITLINQPATGGATTAVIKNELDQTTTSSFTFNSSNQSTFTPGVAHYTIFIKTTNADGSIGTKAYFIINNDVNTTFSNNNPAPVCLPGGALEYPIELASLRTNFPGNTYRINWGDGTETTYTICDLKAGVVRHIYTQSSCSQTYTSGNTTIYNAFGINFQALSPFNCGTNNVIGFPVSTPARVITITRNRLDGPDTGCSGQAITFNNTSILGENPDTNSPGCIPDETRFNWFVDNQLVLPNVLRSSNLTYTFTRGEHTVELRSISNADCVSPYYYHTICIQDPPQPSFNFATNTICSPGTLKPTNTSIIDNICNNNNTYEWSVTPAVPFAVGNAASAEPTFNFTTPGVYTVRLFINTASCGRIGSVTQRIVVNASPTVTMSADVALCNLATYDFNPTTTGPTKTSFTGTMGELPDTYTWTVTGGAFAFTNSTNSNTKYPSIQFQAYATYTVSVTHKNSCGTETKSQVISFTPAPVVAAGTDITMCYNDVSVTLNGSVTGATTTISWIGGNGIFTPDRNALNATYEPTPAEKNAGRVNLTLRATTNLPSPCNLIDDEVVINIRPKITPTSATDKTICTGNSVAYTPTVNNATATFTWTAAALSANVTGFTPSGTGNITDVLTNTDPVIDAYVNYTITPTVNGCQGDPFVLTVKIVAKPTVTAVPVATTICHQQNGTINLTSNQPGTRYTWSSVKTAGITGNSANGTPSAVTSISDQLANNTTAVGTVTYTITPVSANGCPNDPVVVTINIEPAPTTPIAGPNESICATSTSYTFKGNTPVVGTGKWTQTSSFTGITINDDDQPNATVFGLQPGITYTFTWTITGAATCNPKSDDVQITVDPLSVGGTANGNGAVCAGTNTGQITLTGQTGIVQYWEYSTDGGNTWTQFSETRTSFTFNNLTATRMYRATVKSGNCSIAISAPYTVVVNPQVPAANAGLDAALCASNTYVLNGNTAPNGFTGLWTLTSGQTGVTFSDATFAGTTVNGLIPGQTYTFRWTISGQAPCPPTFDEMVIRVDLPSYGGLTAGSTNVCAGSNSGSITLSAQVGNIVRWESSTNGGVTWTAIANTTTTLNYLNITTTTQYRAFAKTASCAESVSSVSTITVYPGATVANAGPDQLGLCNVTSTILAGNQPGVNNTGLWTYTGPAGPAFADATVYNTPVTGLTPGQSYTFTWTITGAPPSPCPPTRDDVRISINLASNGGTTSAGGSFCAGAVNGNITLIGYVGSILRWEKSEDGGNTWVPIANTNPTLPFSGLTVTTQYRAIVENGTCGAVPSTVSTVTVNQSVVPANAGLDQVLCNQPSVVLAGNSPGANIGTWTLKSGQAGVNITNPNQNNTTVTGLVGGQTYIFEWTISPLAGSPCSPSIDQVTITNLSELLGNVISTPSLITCNQQDVVLTGSQPTGGNNTYTYIWQSATSATGPWTNINGETSRDLRIKVSASFYYRRIVNSGTCSIISNELNITVLPSIATNTINSVADICLTHTPDLITGSQPTGGDGSSYAFAWQESTDNGANWTTIIGATNKDYQPPAITQTTLYRRLVSSSACTGSLQNISNEIKIIVKPNAIARFTQSTTVGCIPFDLVAKANIVAEAHPDRNAIYTWFAIDGNTKTQIGTGINFPPYTIDRDNANITIRLEVTSSIGCDADFFETVFQTRQNVIPDFIPSATRGCGIPLTVNFKNSSNALTGVTFEWKVDGATKSNAVDFNYDFMANADGSDREYKVKLIVHTPCGDREIEKSILAVAPPNPKFSTDKVIGCSKLLVTFTIPRDYYGSGNYQYDFGDGNQSVVFQDRTTVITHEYVVTPAMGVKIFYASLSQTNDCRSGKSQEIPIKVTPPTVTASIFAGGDQQTVCAGTEIKFFNMSAGAETYEYYFDGDTQHPLIVPATSDFLLHTFTTAGPHSVKLIARNSCSFDEQTTSVTVYPKPTVGFRANVISGCSGFTVQFTNTSTGANSYAWDFGDGSPIDPRVNPTHTYSGNPQSFSVTLVATNTLNCSDPLTRTDYIRIVGPPKAEFTVLPAATINIPDYTFSFKNQSTEGAETFKWTFGDGTESTLKDPTHKYADTGKFVVTLRAYNQTGCVDSLQNEVRIVGVPGYLFVPNSFIPGSTSVPLTNFMAKGSGMASWKMTIFNKWGQVIWETTKLDDGKPLEGWDGTYNGVQQPQGIYFWKIDVQFINGTEWKGMSYDKSPPRRTGQIYLIR